MVTWSETGARQFMKSGGYCQWFALCMQPASVLVRHPILGTVPTCPECVRDVMRPPIDRKLLAELATAVGNKRGARTLRFAAIIDPMTECRHLNAGSKTCKCQTAGPFSDDEKRRARKYMDGA